MKCYIRRYNKDEKEWGFGYLKPVEYYDRSDKQNKYYIHWVADKKESMTFNSVKEARWFIKIYKIKNCEVEK